MSHTSMSDFRSRSPVEGVKLQVPTASHSIKDLKDLIVKRSSVKGRITKFKNLLNEVTSLEKPTDAQMHTLLNRYERFRELFIYFEDLQSDIELLNSSELDSELDIRDAIERDFSSLIAETKLFIDTNLLKPNSNADSLHSARDSSKCCSTKPMGFKLPLIKVAKFDGDFFKWMEFRDTFISLIHSNDRIEPVHKFHYLNSYLEGEASNVISNLPVCSANYEDAWNLLCERYNNVKQLKKNHYNLFCNFPPTTRDSAKSMRNLIDHVSKGLRALKTLGEPTDSWDGLVVELASAKFDSGTKFKWEEYTNSLENSPTLQDLFKFLNSRANVLDAVKINKSKGETTSSHKCDKSHTKSFAISADVNAGSSDACLLCKGRHRIYDCAAFLAKSPADRAAEAMKLRLCLNCLRKGHSSRQCRLGPCSTCKRRHNTLLHREPSQPVTTSNVHTSASSTVSAVERVSTDNVATDDVVSMSVKANHSVLLSTALVDVFNPVTNQYTTIRALLDSGSQSSLITDSLKNKLQLTPQPIQVDIVGIGNVSTSHSLQRCVVQVKSKHNDFKSNVSCLVLPQLTGNLPKKSFNISQLNLPPNIKLADPTFNQCAQVDMLIGVDLFWSVIEGEQISLGPNQPIMRKSKLGWILAGPLYIRDISKSQNKTVNCHHIFINCSDSCSNEVLDQQLTKFWELEQIPHSTNTETEEEIACENHFVMNTSRNDEGRFIVKLPLHTEPDCLGNSFIMAKRQFFALEKRFNKNPELKDMYSKFIQEYSDLGHLSESKVLIPEQSYFIPHHAVLKPTSESTKLRVVFNGSAPTTSGYSINDLQLTGPNIQDSLLNILLRFRQYAYVLSGDIEKMYRQVLIREDHRNLQLILWRNCDNEPLKSLRLNTVTYGYTSSSFLSTRCLWQLGEECSDPKIRTVIQNDFLVDDLLTGCDSEAELILIRDAIENALTAGCFTLRKYRSNSRSLISESQNVQRNLIISSSLHTLGVGWNPNEDYIHFPTNYENKSDNPTKRSILSDSCKVFDPLGLLSLFTIKPKILIQQLWVQKIDWDEPVPNNILKSWQSFIKNMSNIRNLFIPRHVLCNNPVLIELHCFCDASTTAYAACVYLRSVNSQGDVTVRLLCAKARVASVKPTTVPRLELCACLLGAQLAAAACRALRCVITRQIFWSDSSIALAWLGARYDKLKTFVANRVCSILELTEGSEWRHVPTTLNPADLASRGVDADKINILGLWWNGPSYLLMSEKFWPTNNKIINNISDLPEVKSNVCVNVDSETNHVINFDKYSNFSRLQRSFAYVLRFVHNCKHSNNKLTGVLQPDELKASLEELVRLAQQELFSSEVKTLHSQRTLGSKNPLLALSPFLDTKNIMRVGGRLKYSCYSFEKRHPMVLHAKHRLVKLLFRHEHLRLLHAGPQLLLASIREYVWPIAGRDLARTTARQCIVCRKVSGNTLAPLMGSLPEQRVNPDFPFASAGVDFAGPFLITDRKGRGCKITKCYLCIFVCLRFKCLHLEAVSELSKDAFILSLRRFISRRGKPTEIFCDNGRNFVAADREIQDLISRHTNDIASFASGEGIKFKFQPAYAPHFGGLWEAGVKSAKFHLKRILGNSHLTFEELATLFSQIEAILNSRPLYPLSSCPDDLQSLTPGHFLIGRPLTSMPSPSLEHLNLNRLDRFQRLERLRQDFWRRWQLEYLAELQQRRKWKVPNRPLQAGDLVLIKEENTPPMSWKLGRIQCLFPGKDGVARVAEIKTASGTYRRGVKYLCPLLDAAAD